MMKKLLLIFFCSIITFSLKAQNTFPETKNEDKILKKEIEESGRMFIGGAASYWNDTSKKLINFEFEPEIGYLFNDNWGIGITLGYGYEHQSKLQNTPSQTTTTFKLNPFARYYYYHKGPFNLYLDGGFGVNFIKEQATSGKGFELGIRPGACVDLTEGLCLCLRMGFAGYRNNYFSGEEEGLGNSGFGFKFAPEELMIGLELEF